MSQKKTFSRRLNKPWILLWLIFCSAVLVMVWPKSKAIYKNYKEKKRNRQKAVDSIDSLKRLNHQKDSMTLLEARRLINLTETLKQHAANH